MRMGFARGVEQKNAASAETVGLLTDDIKLDEEVFYIKPRRHSWRTLEAKGSERGIPLVAASVWVHKHVNLSFINLKF